MKHSSRSMTQIELLAVLGIIVVLFLALLPMLVKAREESRRQSCSQNCSIFSQVFFAYTQSANEYYPFAWAKCDEWKASMDHYGDEPGEAYVADSATSLGNLYPNYLSSAKIFRCPSTKDDPKFRTNVPLDENGKPATSGFLWDSQKNYTLTDSSYGYDCRLYPSLPSNHVIFGDMDGTLETDGGKSNHGGKGQYVAHIDGHVRWRQNNYGSNSAHDNVYSEEPWSADTDCYLVRSTAVLGRSYDGYPSLKKNP